MTFYRPLFDTSFTDLRQTRLVVRQLSHRSSTSNDFRRFCSHLFHQKNFTYDQYQIEFAFVHENLIQVEAALNEIQFYRRAFGYLFFAVCQTSEELRLILEEFNQWKQRNPTTYRHLIVRYKIENSNDDDDDEISNENGEKPDYAGSSRLSISSMVSIESSRANLSSLRGQESISIEENDGNVPFDQVSLTNSLPSFTSMTNENGTEENDDNDDDGEATASIMKKETTTKSKSRPSLFKQRTLPNSPIFDSFDSDLNRAYHNLEASLNKSSNEPKRLEPLINSMDFQLTDIRLMIDYEKDCSLVENSSTPKLIYDRVIKSVMNECHQQIIKRLFEHYLNAQTIVQQENGKNKLSKKLLEARILKRKCDCCLLFGMTDRAQKEYQRAAEALKSQNDSAWNAAALEGRVAGYFLLFQKPKRPLSKARSLLTQSTLTRKISMDKLFNRSNSLSHLQGKMETVLQIYNKESRSLFNQMTYRLELDACLRWCSLLMEQIDIRKYREAIEELIPRINALGATLTDQSDSINLYAYLADAYDFIGWKRKSALHSHTAVFFGLNLLSEQKDYESELPFLDKLIKRARTGYGIDDNQLLFPLIQKTILHESIQVSVKQNDSATITENIRFAIESLIEDMDDEELENLLTYLKGSDQSISCSYCSIPRLKSLDPLPLADDLKARRVHVNDGIFIVAPKRIFLSHQQTLHRKVDFLWVRNERTKIAFVLENYLPSVLIIDRLAILSDIRLETELKTQYQIPARSTKRILVDCMPKETGELRIQGLQYRLWSTDQQFNFVDFPTLRQCTCAVDVIQELPILDLQCLSLNGTSLDLCDEQTIYKAQVLRGENVLVTLNLINRSDQCSIDQLEIEVYTTHFSMTSSIRVSSYNLPLNFNETVQPVVDLTDLYDRYLSRQDRDRSLSTLESLIIEIRLNYANVASNPKYYRRNTIKVEFEYLPSISYVIHDFENHEDDAFYLIRCTMENHLTEEVFVNESPISPAQSSIVFLKQEKICLETFPSSIEEYLAVVREQLPTSIEFRTGTSNKNLRLPIDWRDESKEKIRNHFHDLLQSPYRCHWHFEQIDRMFHVYLCVQSLNYPLSSLEFHCLASEESRFLNSNRICFEKIEPNQYLFGERLLISSSENAVDVLVVDVRVNQMKWKRMTLTV